MAEEEKKTVKYCVKCAEENNWPKMKPDFFPMTDGACDFCEDETKVWTVPSHFIGKITDQDFYKSGSPLKDLHKYTGTLETDIQWFKTNPALEELVGSIENIKEFAQRMSNSDYLLQEQFRGKPTEIEMAIWYGIDLGMTPIQSIMNLIPKEGHMTMFGDMAKALVNRSGLVERWEESESGTIKEETYSFTISTKRVNGLDKTITLDVNWMKRSGLWVSKDYIKKAGQNVPSSVLIRYRYPDRTIQYNCLSWVIRAVYPDILKGIRPVEEVDNYINNMRKEARTEGFYAPIPELEDSAKETSSKITHKASTGNQMMQEQPITNGEDESSKERDKLVAQMKSEGKYTEKELLAMKGKKIHKLKAIMNDLGVYPELIKGKNTQQKMVDFVLAKQEGPEAFNEFLAKNYHRLSVQSYHRKVTEYEKQKDNVIPLKVRQQTKAAANSNKYSIEVTEVNDQTKMRTIQEARKLSLAIRDKVMDTDNMEEFQKSLAKAGIDPAEYTDSGEFIRSAPKAIIDDWLNKNYV